MAAQDEQSGETAVAGKHGHDWRKPALEIGPLIIFFATNAATSKTHGLFLATGVFMAATIVALVLSWVLYRRIAIMPLVSAVVVTVFGSLTLILQDETFIKIKPTIIYTIFGAALIGGLAFGKSLLGIVFESAFDLDADGWRKLTLRWALFFLALAVLNEWVWRSFSTDTWVAFKAFGMIPITFVFALLQMPLIQRHSIETGDEEASG